MTTFSDINTLQRIGKYALLYCLVWPLCGVAGLQASSTGKIANTVDELPYPPNDPYFSKQGDLFEALHIKETWKAIRESKLPRRDVIVTVLDSGVATQQPDLEGKLLKGEDASGAWWPSVEDTEGHGTAMAGIIASGINNAIGIAGIADIVKIRPIRLMYYGNRPSLEQIERGWKIANEFNDSDIVVFAISGTFSRDKAWIYQEAITKAVEKGSFVVVSATNTNTTEPRLPCVMAEYMPGVVCVTATFTSRPTMLLNDNPTFANFGVPGTEVMGPKLKNFLGWWDYEMSEGCSCSTAIVGGIAALMRSFKKFDPDMMKQILVNSTEGRVRTKTGVEMSYGVLRPDLAVKRAIAMAR